MADLSWMIRERRRVLGLTLDTVSTAVGCGRSYLSQIETGRRSRPPSRAILEKLEGILGFNDGELVGYSEWAVTPPEVRARVSDLERQREETRKAAGRLRRALQQKSLDDLHESGELERLVRAVEGEGLRPSPSASNLTMVASAPVRVPVINKVAAGYPTEFTDLGYPARIADAYVGVPGLTDRDAFAARVSGDSMEPRYVEGDIVVFSPAARVRDGSDCFIRFERDAETTFKRVAFESTPDGAEHIHIRALNDKYPPRRVRREDIAGLYPAVYVVREIAVAD